MLRCLVCRRQCNASCVGRKRNDNREGFICPRCPNPTHVNEFVPMVMIPDQNIPPGKWYKLNGYFPRDFAIQNARLQFLVNSMTSVSPVSCSAASTMESLHTLQGQLTGKYRL